MDATAAVVVPAVRAVDGAVAGAGAVDIGHTAAKGSDDSEADSQWLDSENPKSCVARAIAMASASAMVDAMPCSEPKER